MGFDEETIIQMSRDGLAIEEIAEELGMRETDVAAVLEINGEL